MKSLERLGMATLALVLLLLVACGPGAPAPRPEAAPATSPVAAAPKTDGAAKPAGELAQIIEGAKKEGAVDVNLSSTLAVKGAEALIAALNKKYGTSIKINYSPTESFPAIASKVVAEAQAGATPSWSIIMGTDQTLAQIQDTVKALESFDWVKMLPGIVPETAVILDGTAVIFTTSLHQAAYNPKVVRAQDVPKTYDDFLDPKWKGKMVHPLSDYRWAQMANWWGEEKAWDYVRKLAKQDLAVARWGDTYTKVITGEFPIAVWMSTDWLYRAEKEGAPFEMIFIDPVIELPFAMSIPKGARQPNAAKLLIAFSLTPEGQKVWWDYTAYSAWFLEGSPAAEKLKRFNVKPVRVPEAWTKGKVTKMAPEMGKILGISQ